MVKKLSLEQRVENMKAYFEIQNVMGTYMVRHIDGPSIATSPEIYALKTPGVSAEIDNWGPFEGASQIEVLYYKAHGDITKKRVGGIVEHDLTTPIIEVAGDGKTARFVWFSPGFIVSTLEGSDELRAQWRWTRTSAAFAKEAGKWKLWKYHVYGTFFCDFDKSWVDDQPKPGRGQLTQYGAGKPTYHNQYSPTGVREAMPEAPLPYDTWDPKIRV